jgi:signal transduction histidine kinase
LLLTGVTFIYSKLSSIGIIKPLHKLSESVRLFRDGHYSTRVDLKLKNEFKDIQDAFNDMAQRIEKETAMREQSENNRKKLIMDISHDLKTPLANTLGYAELLIHDTNISPEHQRVFLQTIYRNSVKANSLITDMFELSKLDSPEFKLQISRVDICEFLREQIGELIPQLEQEGYTYEFSIPEKEISAHIDLKHMQRVIQNLVSNTIKHTPKGTHITIALTETDDGIQLTYSDNGGGIPDELQDSIFNPFVRADTARSTEGTGLGLAIVHRIVTAHGGSIRLDSNIKDGCSFIISLKDLR